MRILCIEDDLGLAQLLQATLAKQHYQVDLAADGQTGWDLAEITEYDLILLDLLLPDFNGITFCQRLRSLSPSLNPNYQTPILLMTGLDIVTNKVLGLDAGADDYVMKPFDLEELSARIRALLRRNQETRSPVLTWGDLCLNPQTCDVTYQNQPIHLASKEYELLELFLRNPDQVFNQARLIDRLWQSDEYPTENAVRTHMKRLRQKLQEVGVDDIFETIYKLGYRLKSPKAQSGIDNQAVVKAKTSPGDRTLFDHPMTTSFQSGSLPPQSRLTDSISPELRQVWQQHYQSYRDRLSMIQQVVIGLAANALTPEQQQRAEREAHTLIGSLGSFGLETASRLSRQVQKILVQPPTAIDTELLQLLVMALQSQLENAKPEDPAESGVAIAPLPISTNPVQAPQANLHQEERLHLALEAAEIGTWHYDLATDIITCCSRCKSMFGFVGNPPKVTYADIAERMHRDDRDWVYQKITTAIAQKTRYQAEYRIVMPDGFIRWVLAQGKAVYDDRGTPISLIGGTMDISDRKQSQLSLQQLNTDLGERVVEGNANLKLINDRLQAELAARRQSDQTLRESKHRLQFLLNYSPAVLFALDPKNNYRGSYISDNGQDLFGYNAETLITEFDMWLQRIHPDDQITLFKNLSQDLENNPQVIREYRYNHPDGSERWILAQLRLIRDSQGEPVEVLGCLMNNTDRKRIEAQLQRSEANLREAARVAHVGNWQFDLASQQIFWSEEVFHLFDRDPGLGEPTYEELTASIHPDDRALHHFRVTQAITKAIPYDMDFRVIRKGGKISYVNGRAKADLDEQGQVVQLFGTVMDITERKRQALIIQETNQRWRSLLDNVLLVVVGLDIQGNVNYVNPYFLRITGYTIEQVLGKHWFSHFLPESQRPLVEHTFQEILENNFHPHYQNAIVSRSGQEHMIVWSNTLVKDEHGNLSGTLSIGEDITERFKLEQIQSEFVSVVSHELRTPLTSMQAALSLLDEKLIDPTSPEGESAIQIAAKGVDRLVRLVNDILDLERLESGKMRLEKRPCCVAELMETAIAYMQDLANQTQIVLNSVPLPFKTQPFQLNADPDRVLQVLINLLSNAIKFSSPGSTVWLRASVGDLAAEGNQVEPLSHSAPPPATILFSVQDHGRGIPLHKLESIFNRFQQVDASDSRSKGGTGLGLAICRSIAQQHGGSIWAESRVGQGSTFYFTLPLQEMSPIE